jgi:hypothetical protein
MIWNNEYNAEDMFERENIELVEAESDERCCGACANFKYEDTDGFGLCVGFGCDFETYCGYVCAKNCKFKPYKR